MHIERSKESFVLLLIQMPPQTEWYYEDTRSREGGLIHLDIFADLIGERQETLIEDKQFILVAETESDREKQKREIQRERGVQGEREGGRQRLRPQQLL